MSSGAFDFGWAITKANYDEVVSSPPRNRMMWWDPRHGGMKPGNTGKIAEGGGGNIDIWQWIRDNPRKVDDWLGGRTIDWPLEGQEVIPWSEFMREENIPDLHGRKRALDAHARYSKAGAMPGIGVQDFPARACIHRTSGACKHCYADDDNYRFNETQARQWEALDRNLTDPMRVASALQETMHSASRAYAPARHLAAPIRHKTSGDFRGAGEISMMSDIISQLPEHEQKQMEHWISTRQYPFWEEFFDARGWGAGEALPESVQVGLSMPGKQLPSEITEDQQHGQSIRRLLEHPQIFPTTFDRVAPGSYICPKSSVQGKGSQCDMNIDPMTGEFGCRVCFKGKPVAYGLHKRGQKRKWTEAEMATALRSSPGRTVI